jgi:hypothetical protein
MVDFDLFRSNNFLGTGFAMVGYAAGAQVMIFYLPLYLQNAYGFAPVVAGVAMLPFALPMFLVPHFGAKLGWPSRSMLCAGLSITAVANACMALLATGRVTYLPFATAMVLAGIGAGVLNGETAKAMQGAVPPQRSGMASGLSGTTRFSALLFGVAGLGAMLITVMADRFVRAAAPWGLDPSTALLAAKRFSAGDANAAMQMLPDGIRAAAGDALRQAFDAGFGAAAWTAAGVAVTALLLTRWLMPSVLASAEPTLLVVPGE